MWQHSGSSPRRAAEWLRSEMGRQERGLIWKPLEEETSEGERCHLAASSAHRWLDEAGRRAPERVAGQLAGIPTSGQMGTDRLWARLRRGARRVVLALVDSVTGVVWAPVDMGLGKMLGEVVEPALMYLLECNQGLVRVSPEWCWRDFRLRLSRGRNHGTDQRLERAAVLRAIYRNFTPAQCGSERKRKYRRPGRSPLDVAGVPPGRVSYPDALGI